MYPIFLVFGPPNAGKGTIVKNIVMSYHVSEIGTGDICRKEKEVQSSLWQEADASMKATKSTLWPTEMLMQAIGDEFSRSVRKGAVIFDGFLRHADQNEHLVRLVQSHCISEVVVIDVHTSDKVCIKRSVERRRPDDEDIHRRLQDFHDHAVPALHALMASAHILPVQRLIFKGDLGETDKGEYRRSFIEGIGKMFQLKTRHSRFHRQPVHH